MRALAGISASLTLIAGALSANPIDIYTPEWMLQTAGTGYVNTGNVERVLLRGDLQFSYHNPVWAAATTTSYTWGTFGGNRAENDWSNRNFFYLWPEKTVYPFAMHWLETGYRRKIDMRNQAGIGATWALFSSTAAVLKLSLMASGEATDYASPAYLADQTLQATDRPLPRATPRLYYRQRLGSDAVKLTSELWYQQAIQTANDYRWHWETGLEIALNQSFSLKTLAVFHYESAVPQRVQRQDVIWTFGISGKWAAEKTEMKTENSKGEKNEKNQ